MSYASPVIEFIEIRPEERLSTTGYPNYTHMGNVSSNGKQYVFWVANVDHTSATSMDFYYSETAYGTKKKASFTSTWNEWHTNWVPDLAKVLQKIGL